MKKQLITFFTFIAILFFQRQGFNAEINTQGEILNDIDKSPMILISEGVFQFGLDKRQLEGLYKKYNKSFISDFFIDTGKKVNLPSYYIDKYEINNSQFLMFINATSYKVVSQKFKSSVALKNPKWPITNVGWSDAIAYAKWAGKRLPTEQEWEKAAKGIQSNLWPWGNEDSGNNYNGKNQGKFTPVNIGSFPGGKSEYGVMDMAGNVYEMTIGRWIDDSPCMKGGSFLNKGFYTMCSFRWADNDTLNGDSWLGFRCVKDLK
jgi:formylglycine-generating enzyme required for sulfatase activity